MTDKVQKIREEVERLFNHVKDSNFESDSGAFYYFKDLLDFIDSLQEEPVTEDLGKYINELSKQFPEVSFAKLSRIAVRVANWQKKQDQKSMEIMDEVYFKSCDMIRKQMIDKACKYLQEHREEVETEDNGISGWISDEFIEDFEEYLKK